MKIAVIGSGISGLSAAHFLSKKHKVDLFEKNDHFGGHSYTVEVFSNNSNEKISEEEKIIKPAIKKLKKTKIKISGPFSADSLFLPKNQKKYDVIVGMYHDQVLTPIKTIMGLKAINITLGLPFIRVSPDHGVATDIVGKKIADPSSLIESIKFFNNIQWKFYQKKVWGKIF